MPRNPAHVITAKAEPSPVYVAPETSDAPAVRASGRAGGKTAALAATAAALVALASAPVAIRYELPAAAKILNARLDVYAKGGSAGNPLTAPRNRRERRRAARAKAKR